MATALLSALFRYCGQVSISFGHGLIVSFPPTHATPFGLPAKVAGVARLRFWPLLPEVLRLRLQFSDKLCVGSFIIMHLRLLLFLQYLWLRSGRIR